mmetsp:Transcript_11930/g.37130  ORF Transcript_11930/g.37130 Transcript_11930/m.37130 type:complete len:202 (+) Transcript_11930:753-1358(+)
MAAHACPRAPIHLCAERRALPPAVRSFAAARACHPKPCAPSRVAYRPDLRHGARRHRFPGGALRRLQRPRLLEARVLPAVRRGAHRCDGRHDGARVDGLPGPDAPQPRRARRSVDGAVRRVAEAGAAARHLGAEREAGVDARQRGRPRIHPRASEHGHALAQLGEDHVELAARRRQRRVCRDALTLEFVNECPRCCVAYRP